MNTLATIAVVIALVVGVPVIIWGMAHRPGRNRIEHGGTTGTGVVKPRHTGGYPAGSKTAREMKPPPGRYVVDPEDGSRLYDDRPEKRVIDPQWVNPARLHDVMPEEDLPRAPYDGPEPGDGR